jgi:hypothetical protein
MLSRPSVLVLLSVSILFFSTSVAGRKEAEPVYMCEWSDEEETWQGCNGKEEAYIAEAIEWERMKLDMEQQRLQLAAFSGGNKVVRGRLVPAGKKMDRGTKDWLGRQDHILTQTLEKDLLSRNDAPGTQDASEGEL